MLSVLGPVDLLSISTALAVIAPLASVPVTWRRCSSFSLIPWRARHKTMLLKDNTCLKHFRIDVIYISLIIMIMFIL